MLIILSIEIIKNGWRKLKYIFVGDFDVFSIRCYVKFYIQN